MLTPFMRMHAKPCHGVCSQSGKDRLVESEGCSSEPVRTRGVRGEGPSISLVEEQTSPNTCRGNVLLHTLRIKQQSGKQAFSAISGNSCVYLPVRMISPGGSVSYGGGS